MSKRSPIGTKIPSVIKIKSSVVWIILSVTLVLSILFGSTIFWSTRNLPPEIPLYYSLATGQEQLAGRGELIGLPIIVSAILISNTIIGMVITSKWRLLSRVLYVETILVLGLLTISLVQISRLIT